MFVKIKLENPERFKSFSYNDMYIIVIVVDNRLVLYDNHFRCVSGDNWVISNDNKILIESIVKNKAKALLNINHKNPLISCVSKNVIFNDVRFSIEEI